ncbi:MAG: hypothetical protein ACE5IY_14945 [bacterium]
MADTGRYTQRTILIMLAASLLAHLFPFHEIFAQETGVKAENKRDKFIENFKFVLNGFTIGPHTRVFPYAGIEDWFDPYGGVKMGHRSFWNSEDKMYHHFKFESYRDYSWKFRYLANSLSSENTKFSFLFKIKLDRDPFFYGIGNATSKSKRVEATYKSVFVGGEIRQSISAATVFRWSPGFWKFSSGLVAGGEFERASDSRYVSSRFSLSDRKSTDYWVASLDNQWSSYVEIALPLSSSAASYARFNVQTRTQFPLFEATKLSIGTRFEYLISSDRDRVPYFAIPEAGSRTGLRGFSKERFRNFALGVYNIELAFPLSVDLDGFLLTDLAQTASNPTRLAGKKIHANLGFGFRLHNTNHPFSVGLAASHDGWKLFSSIALGSPW